MEAPGEPGPEDGPEWVDLKVELIFDELYLQANKGVLEDVEVDQLTWTAIISGGMTKFYGLVGSALYFSIEKLEARGLKAVIRIMKEDEAQFLNSFFTHKFKFSSYYGGGVDSDCHVERI